MTWRDGRLARAAPPVPAARTQASTRQPLLYAASAFAGGVWAGEYVWRPPVWWVIAAIVFGCCAIYLLRRRSFAASVLVLGAIFAGGALTIQVRGASSTPTPNLGDGEQVVVTAHVIAEGEL